MVYGERCSGRACVVRWSTRCLLLCGEQSGGERECLCRYLRIRVVAIGSMRIIMCVENVGFRTGLPDAGAHSTVLFFIRRDS